MRASLVLGVNELGLSFFFASSFEEEDLKSFGLAFVLVAVEQENLTEFSGQSLWESFELSEVASPAAVFDSEDVSRILSVAKYFGCHN